MSFTKNKLAILILLLLSSLSLNTFFVHSWILGLLFFPLAAVYSLIIGSILYKNLDDIYQPFCGFLTLISGWIILGTGIYYIYGITKPISVLLAVIPMIFLIWAKLPLFFGIDKFQVAQALRLELRGTMLNLIAIIGNLAVIIILFQHQTTDVLISPWHAVTPWFFLLYAITTGLTIITAYRAQTAFARTTHVTLYLFTTFSVAAIIYPLGFGFDAFVHRATEAWIQLHGFILPKYPYYIGQYSFVVLLSTITTIPLKWVDILLVPLLAARTLPIAVEYVLNRIHDIPKHIAVILTLIIPFLFYFSFHLTTPHNLVLLLTILTIFFIRSASNNTHTHVLPFLLSAAALLTHPLLGAPLFVFVCITWGMKKLPKHRLPANSLFPAIILFAIISLLLPGLFSLQQYLNTHTWPSLANPLTKIPEFLALIARPYWYAKNSPIIFELLYAWQWLITPIFVCLGIYGLYKNTHHRKAHNALFLAMALGLVVDAWLLRSVIVFPNVIVYEQGDYPLRLLKSSLLFLLPFAMYGVYVLYIFVLKKIKNRRFGNLFFVITISIVLTLSFYLSYPQKNPKARFPGFNVSNSDFSAVRWIHAQHADNNYIVLANQLVSAAALTEYSFAKHFNTEIGELFYYSLPTGGPLYQYYGKMIYEGQKREDMLHAMDVAGVETAYFVVNKYWANSDNIIEGAKKSANEWQKIDDGNVWVFVYQK